MELRVSFTKRLSQVSIWTGFILSLSACAIANVYETVPLKNQLQEQLTRISDERARIQIDHEDKKAVLRSLSSQRNQKTASLVPQLKNLEEQMQNAKKQIHDRNQNLINLSGQFSALAYKREKIKSTDEVYEQAGGILESFEKEIEAVNADIKAYSSSSNQFAAIVNERNLFRSYNVEDIDRGIKEAISSINVSFYKLKASLDRKVRNFELIAAKPGRNSDNIAALEETLKLMESQVKLLSSKSEQLNNVRKSFLDRFQERTVIKSTDADFDNFLRLKNIYEQAVRSLDQVDKDFSEASSKFNRLAEKHSVQD